MFDKQQINTDLLNQQGPTQYGHANAWGYTGTESEADTRAWITLLDQSKTLEQMERFLKGEELIQDMNKKWRWQQTKQPLMNKEGINAVMYTLTPYVSAIFALSQYDENTIRDRCRELANDMTWLIFCRYRDFDINPAHKTSIKNMIVNLFETNIRKSKDAKMLDIFGKTYVSKEVINPNEKPSIFTKLRNSL